MTSPTDPRDPTTRFTSRVDLYVKCRPGYPDALRDALRRELGLSPASTVADIGAGTGISTEMLRQIGCRVYAVEPNAAMRAAAAARFSGDAGVESVDGRAEQTGLPDASVDAVTAGQAFHWFRHLDARRELARILRPGGQVALFWNTRRSAGTPLLVAYEQALLDYGTDYTAVDHRHVDAAALRAFFGGAYQTRVFAYEQVLDFDGLLGRVFSSSHTPPPGHQNHEPMAAALRRAFDAYQEDGHVRVTYDTELFFGPLHGAA